MFLFRELICKDVDWTGLGMPAYSCFNAFFTTIWTETASASARSKILKDDVAADLAVSSMGPLPHPPVAAATLSSVGVSVEGTDPSDASLLPPPPPPAVETVPSAPPFEEDLTELGVDTLWRVTLTSLDKEVADSATLDLLTVSSVIYFEGVSLSGIACSMSCIDLCTEENPGTSVGNLFCGRCCTW